MRKPYIYMIESDKKINKFKEYILKLLNIKIYIEFN